MVKTLTTVTAMLAVPALVACGTAAKSPTPISGSGRTTPAMHPTETPDVFRSGSLPLHDREIGTVRGLFIAVGGPSFASNTPQMGTVTLTDVSTGYAYKFTTGPDGKFSATIPASTYQATGLTPQYLLNNREGECQAQTPVTVRIGQTVAVTVECQR